MPSPASPPGVELAAERWMPVPVEGVWEQCTSKLGLESWWSPEDLRTTVEQFDARRGGAVSMALRYVPALLGPEHERSFRAAGIPISLFLHGTVRELEPCRCMVVELTLTVGRAGAGVTNVTRLELEPVGAGTRVRLVVTGTGDKHLLALGKANLEGQLDRLARALANRA